MAIRPSQARHLEGASAAALILLGLATTACLVTSPLDPRFPTPDQNHAPRFDDLDVSPSLQPWVIKPEVGTGQQSCVVQASIMVVVDEDVEDEVVAKWFVDGRYQGRNILTQTSSPQRIGPKFVFDARKFPDNPDWPGFHILKVVISDGFIDRVDTGEDAGESDDPTTDIQEGMGSVSYTWVIDTHNAFQCANDKGDRS